MSNMTDYMENKIADFLRGQGLTLPTNWYVALGSAAADGSFTEISFTGYARLTVPRSLAKWAGTQAAGSTLASSGTSHQTSNNDAISFGTPGGASGSPATAVGLFDASSGGNCWAYAAIASITITNGSPAPLQIAAGALVFTLGKLQSGDAFANKMVDLIWRAQAYSMPSPVYVAAMSVAPTGAGGGTEFSAGGYARVALTPSLANLSGTQAAASTSASSGTGGRISNNAAITFPSPSGADQGTANSTAIYAASSGGDLMFFGTLTAARSIVNGGPPLSFAPDKYGITMR